MWRPLSSTGPPSAPRPSPRGNGSSAHTSIAWELDGGGAIAKGDLMWPNSWRAGETHAGELVRVVEAGVAPGCAPARLPKGVARGRAGAIHPIDADPSSQGDVFDDLAIGLERLSDRGCAPAKR
jgi:hypothetical protein